MQSNATGRWSMVVSLARSIARRMPLPIGQHLQTVRQWFHVPWDAPDEPGADAAVSLEVKSILVFPRCSNFPNHCRTRTPVLMKGPC